MDPDREKGIAWQGIQNHCSQDAYRATKNEEISTRAIWEVWQREGKNKIKNEPNRNFGAEECNDWTESFNSRLDIMKERISEHEDRSTEVFQLEKQKEKRMIKVKTMWSVVYHQEN